VRPNYRFANLRPRLSQRRYFGRKISRHRIPDALALVVLWVAGAAEVPVCSDPSERMRIVRTFFGSDECNAGTDGAVAAGGATPGGGAEAARAIGTAGRRVLGSEEITAVFGGS
jgi:hypothetical protein